MLLRAYLYQCVLRKINPNKPIEPHMFHLPQITTLPSPLIYQTIAALVWRPPYSAQVHKQSSLIVLLCMHYTICRTLVGPCIPVG